jgi:hypothetical protein
VWPTFGLAATRQKADEAFAKGMKAKDELEKKLQR